MKAIVRKQQHRKLVETSKRESVPVLRGRVVKAKKIARWMNDNKVSEDAIYAPSPTAGDQSHSSTNPLLTSVSRYPRRAQHEDDIRTRLPGAESCGSWRRLGDGAINLRRRRRDSNEARSTGNLIYAALVGKRRVATTPKASLVPISLVALQFWYVDFRSRRHQLTA